MSTIITVGTDVNNQYSSYEYVSATSIDVDSSASAGDRASADNVTLDIKGRLDLVQLLD